MVENDSNYIGCPNCGVRYRWRNELASKKILCPCGCKFRMPNIGAGPPTTITLPPKGNAVVGAGLRSGQAPGESLPHQPLDASDAVGELARLHLLDDLKQKIDNDGTLNTGRFVLPSTGDRTGQPTSSTSAFNDDDKLSIDADDPLLPGVPDQPAPGNTTDSLANIAQGARSDRDATGNYELNLDAFTPASSLIAPSELKQDNSLPEPSHQPVTGPVSGETLSRAELKRRRKTEMDEEVYCEHQKTSYVYPLACALTGLLLIFANIFLLGPRVDQIVALSQVEHDSHINDIDPHRPIRQDSPLLAVQVDNTMSDVSPRTKEMARPVGESQAHVMPQGLIASPENSNYTKQVALYKYQVDGPINMIGRSIRSIVFIIFSFIFSIVGILACIRILGSGFDGLISLTLKLLAISLVLDGSMSCMDSVLQIITEGLPVGDFLTILLGLALFWSMCAWLLEMSWVEVLIMYLFARVFAFVCMVSLVGMLLYWMVR